ncbi:hypothetical protein, partial [Sphingomonas sp. KC8]
MTRSLVRHPFRFGMLALGTATLAVAAAIATPAMLETAVTTSPSPVPVPLRSGLGLNLTSAIYYSGERALMNLAQGSGGWMWQASWSAPWGVLDTGRLDGADTVKSLNPG